MKRRIFSLESDAETGVRFSTGSPARRLSSLAARGSIREVTTIHTVMDTLTRRERSKHMALIRSKDTNPELIVRKIARSCGYRFRLNVPDLPGKPDLVFLKRNKAIFVHGCFWHGHNCRRGKNRPHSNLEYWRSKLLRNKGRDRENRKLLRRMGWQVLVVWECQLGNLEHLRSRIRTFIEA